MDVTRPAGPFVSLYVRFSINAAIAACNMVDINHLLDSQPFILPLSSSPPLLHLPSRLPGALLGSFSVLSLPLSVGAASPAI